MSEQVQNKSTKTEHKPGKTLLVKPREGKYIDESWLTLDGLSDNGVSKTEKTGSYFLTFTDVDKSEKALNELKQTHSDNIMVKYAYYNVFFKFSNSLDKDTSYDVVKKLHSTFVKENTNSEVLYYKLYRNKEGEYLSCGDITLDTKEALDKLLSKDSGFKEFDLGNNMTGTFYRYDRNGSKKTNYNLNLKTA